MQISSNLFVYTRLDYKMQRYFVLIVGSLNNKKTAPFVDSINFVDSVK